jgi:hypothetical protein
MNRQFIRMKMDLNVDTRTAASRPEVGKSGAETDKTVRVA